MADLKATIYQQDNIFNGFSISFSAMAAHVVFDATTGVQLLQNDQIPSRSPMASLENAKTNRLAWTTVARIFRQVTAEAGQNRRLAEKDAVKSSGYSLGVLKRFVIAQNFIESPWLLQEKMPPKHVLESSFTAIEIIERISRRDPSRAAKLMEQLGTPGLRVEMIRDELANLSGGYAGSAIPRIPTRPTIRPAIKTDVATIGATRGSSASARREREDNAFAVVESMLPKLCGRVAVFHRPLGVPTAPLRCDAIAWLDSTMQTADGFEFLHAPSSLNEVLFSDQMNRALFAATFFRRHFLVFSADTDRDFVDRAVRILKFFKADSMGVIFLYDRERVKLQPGGGAVPNPDRRGLLPTICPNGRWAKKYLI